MSSDKKAAITVVEASQDFPRAISLAEEHGQVYLLEKNEPRYLLVDLEKSPVIDMTEDEKIDFVAARILKKHKDAFRELAKW